MFEDDNDDLDTKRQEVIKDAATVPPWARKVRFMSPKNIGDISAPNLTTPKIATPRT